MGLPDVAADDDPERRLCQEMAVRQAFRNGFQHLLFPQDDELPRVFAAGGRRRHCRFQQRLNLFFRNRGAGEFSDTAPPPDEIQCFFHSVLLMKDFPFEHCDRIIRQCGNCKPCRGYAGQEIRIGMFSAPVSSVSTISMSGSGGGAPEAKEIRWRAASSP